MRITRVKIKNFRSIQELDIELPQVCALVGPNNAGKTNILEAIKRVLAGSWVRAADFSTDDIYLRDENREIEIACTLDPPLEYVKFRKSDPVPIHTLSFKYTRYRVGPNKGEPRLEQQCLTAEGKQPSVLARAPRKGEQHNYEPLIGIPGDLRKCDTPICLLTTGGGTSWSKSSIPSATNFSSRTDFLSSKAIRKNSRSRSMPNAWVLIWTVMEQRSSR
jgi:putative ATP-dependent endonuclease of the OLD family